MRVTAKGSLCGLHALGERSTDFCRRLVTLYGVWSTVVYTPPPHTLGFGFVLLVYRILRGTIVNRTSGMHKTLHI